MKVLMVSFISSPNIGDQLIVKTIDEHLLDGYEVIKYDYKLVREDAVMIQTDHKERSAFKQFYLDHIRKNPLVDRIRDSINKRNVRNNPNWESFIKDLADVDLLMIGGGNAIFDLTVHSSSYYMIDNIIEEAKKLNVPTFACSIGIGPFVTKEQEENTIRTLAKADYVTTRDKKSYNYLKNNKNTYLSIDPVFGLETLPKNKATDKKTIGLSIIDLLNNKQTTKENNEYIEGLVSLINQLDDYNVVLYSSVPYDYKTVNSVYNQVSLLDNVSIVSVESIDQLLDLYTHFDLVIGARMHSLIVAVSQSIPIIGLSWQPKVHAMFDMIGESDSVYPIHELNKLEDTILKLVERKLYDEESEERINKVNELVEKQLKINYDIIEAFSKEASL